jgi:hypothetical protein
MAAAVDTCHHANSLLKHRVIIVPQTSEEPPRRVVLEVNRSIVPSAGGMYLNQPTNEIMMPAEQVATDLATISNIQKDDRIDVHPIIDPNQFNWE